MLKNDLSNYGSVARIIHWLMAFGIIFMLIIGYYMARFAEPPYKYWCYDLHKATGVVLLALGLIRVWWRLANISPSLPADTPLWQRFAAHTNIFLLYLLLLIMPISGVLMSLLGGWPISVYGLFTIKPVAKLADLSGLFWQAHVWAGYTFVGCFCLHVLGALHHHFIRKDQVLRRMLCGEKLY